MSQSLCEICAWMREISTANGSCFLLCQLSFREPTLPKYPRQPVVQCGRFERKGSNLSLYRDRAFTFRFTDDRIIGRFHLEGVDAGRPVSVFKIEPETGKRLGLLARDIMGESGWLELAEPIIVRSGEVFIAVPEGEE